MPETLIDIMQAHAASQKSESVAFTFLRDGKQSAAHISFQELDQRARAVAAELQSRNMAGRRVLLLYPSGIEFVSVFMGCLYAGAIAVPAPPPDASRTKRSLPRLQRIIGDCDAALVLAEASNPLASMAGPFIQQNLPIAWLETDVIPNERGDDWKAVNAKADDLAYLQYTSGSIGDPKGIEISHGNLLYHARYLQQTCDYDEQSVSVTWMPNFHDWGLVEGLVEPMFNGTPCYLFSPFSFIKRPNNWLEAITRFQATHSQGPTFAYEHCLRRIPPDQLDGIDLRSWRAAGIAAEPINFQVMNEFHERFAQCGFHWNTFCPAFGLGEATLMVTFCGLNQPATAVRLDPDELEQDRAVEARDGDSHVRTVVSCGKAYAETKLAIVDPDTSERVADGRVGEIWVSDPAVARGYWNRPADTERTFKAKLRDDDELYLRTGDLGFVRDGQLYVTGRLKDLIIIRGSNHYPQDIEWTVQRTHAAVRGQTGAAFSIGQDGIEKLVVLQEINRKHPSAKDLDQVISEVVVQIADEHELDVFDLMLLKRGAIPKTASGKVRRQASRQAYLLNQLTPLAQKRSWEKNPNGSTDTPGPEIAVMSDNADKRPASNEQADEIIGWLREYASSRINPLLMDQRRSVPPHIILDFGNRGIFGLQVPTRFGGLGLDNSSTLRILEQLSAVDVSLATLVCLSNANGLRPSVNFARPEVQQRLLPDLASGRHLAAFALSEPAAGANVGAIRTAARRCGPANWTITGDKRWNGSSWAEVITVIAREFDAEGGSCGVSAFLLKQGSTGLRIGEEALTMGLRGIVQNSLHLEQVSVSENELLGNSGEGWNVVNDALFVGRLYVAAVCLGGMKRTLQLLYRYAATREISTGRLANHPNTHRHLSEIASRIALIESVSRQLADEMDSGVEIDPLFMMAVKVAASDYFNQTTALAVQLLGGRGYMENNEIPRLFRDARALSIGEGANESLIGYIGQPHHAERVAGCLLQRDAAQIQSRFLEANHEIRLRCDQRPNLSNEQRRLWSDYLIGTVAVDAILASFIKHAAQPTAWSSYDWCQYQLDQTIQRAMYNAASGAISRELDAIHHVIRDFETDIGDLRHQLAGEDQALDPELRAELVEDTAAARPDVATENAMDQRGSHSAERRGKLKKLLNEKITSAQTKRQS